MKTYGTKTTTTEVATTSRAWTKAFAKRFRHHARQAAKAEIKKSILTLDRPGQPVR